MGAGNIGGVSSQNIVALCDVDDERAKETYSKYPDVPKFRDFRKMFDKMENAIDAVIVATPDHTHAVAAMAAMQRGKHVYVQKPLTKSIWEARQLTAAARRYGVVTQMGNQGHSGEGVRLICEWIWDGAIGEVRQVHSWTNRPVWPQGVKRPQGRPPVPESLDWDLWLGPVAQRPYHPSYLPFNWRGWYDFGTGAFGDMGCHILDPVYTALKLTAPTSVEASVAKQWHQWDKTDSYPTASVVDMDFPAREGMPPVKLTWFDGGLQAPRPMEMDPRRKMGEGGSGTLFIGSKGKLMCGTYGGGPQLIPYAKHQAYRRPPKTLKRIKTSHEMNWVEACKRGGQASSRFDYSGPFTETVLLGALAQRFPGQRLLWDSKNLKITNHEEAAEFVKPPYRKGWGL
jgi:predicted dehydrogenase